MTIVCKLVICRDEKIVYETPMSFRVVEQVVSYWPDNQESSELFDILSEHPAAQVREYVCDKEFLGEKTADKLAQDSSLAVLRRIISNEVFRRIATEDSILQLVAKDNEIATTVGGNFESFKNADTQKIIDQLLLSSDPSILLSLAENYSTPRKVLKSLASHHDPSIADQAKKSLKG